MRKLSIILGLIAAVGCSSGDPVNNPPGGTSVAGTWSLQTYNGGALPYSGSVNANGSINRVDSG
jgi:hypothetical protein